MSFTLGNPIAVSTNFIKSNPAVPVYKGTEEPENLFGVIYHIEIGYNENNKEEGEKLYNYLLQNNINAIIDDRENLNIGNRINDVYVLGTPKMIILGTRFDGNNYEVEDTKTNKKGEIKMDEQEQVVINLIVNSGSARSSAIEAIQYAKAGDIEKAEESLGNAKEAVNEAHHSQTEMIQAEIRGEKAPLSLLMVHAQDHLMTSLLCIDLAQEFVDVYKKIG